MQKEGFGERLRAAMEASGVKAAELGRMCDVNKSTISQYLSGKYEAKHERVVQFAEALRCSPMWLEGYDVPMSGVSPDYPDGQPDLSNKLPVVGIVAAGMGVLAGENITEYRYADKSYCDKEHFFLIVEGESMWPLMYNGDYILCERREQLNDGEIGVFLVNGCEGLVKKYREAKDGIVLESVNPCWKERRFTASECENVRIIAKVIQCVHNF